jgi:hypothetical protein
MVEMLLAPPHRDSRRVSRSVAVRRDRIRDIAVQPRHELLGCRDGGDERRRAGELLAMPHGNQVRRAV